MIYTIKTNLNSLTCKALTTITPSANKNSIIKKEPDLMDNKLSFVHKICIPSLFDLIIVTVFIVMIMAFPIIQSFDIWWHLKTGELILNGVFPKTDVYSFTAFGQPWILHEWGSEVISFLFYKKLGIAGLIILKSFISALVFGLVFNIMIKKKINILIAFLFTLMIMISTSNAWTMRPHLFTHLFLILLFYIYTEFRHHHNLKILRYLPLLFVLWINVHGGFIIGFVFLSVCICTEWISTITAGIENDHCLPPADCKSLMNYTILSFLACFINPNTYKGVFYPLLYIGNQMPVNFVAEWFPSNIKSDFEFAIIVFLIILGLGLNKKKLFFYEMGLIIVFTFFAFSATRHIAIFALIVIPIITQLWQDIIPIAFTLVKAIAKGKLYALFQKVESYFSSRSTSFLLLEKQLNYHVIPIAVITVFILLISIGFGQSYFRIKETSYPDKLVDFIKKNDLQGNIFNQYAWGGFLIWELPDKKVFIDGRMDVYKKKISEPYVTVLNLKAGWEKIIEEYSIKLILVKKDEIISRFLLQISSDWILLKESDNAFLFSKQT